MGQKDAGPEEGGLGGSHIDWRREQVVEEVGSRMGILHRLEEKEILFTRV